MTEFYIKSPDDRRRCHVFIDKMDAPFRVKIVKGKGRSIEQNRLMWLWMNEAADQLKEYTASQYQALCKLHFGVPILRGEDAEFRELYDAAFEHIPYEQKVKLMGPPINFPVTRLMKSGQLKRFLDDVYDHFKGKGVWLTEPEDQNHD